jgi:hypothetical protein
MSHDRDWMRDLSDAEYEVADQIEDALRAVDVGREGLTPSQISRKIGNRGPMPTVVSDVLRWMVVNQYVRTTGNGAWQHYHSK